jgi:ADP-ribosylglycohydrolase
MACIAGGIAQAFYGSVPAPIASAVRTRLPDDFLDVLDRFERRYGLPSSATSRG